MLNDILRYWWTIAVDYQAKRWEKYGQAGWGLRFLKLIISRKIAYAGTLVSLLSCQLATVDYFFTQFDMPPLARLAQIHDQLRESEQDALRTVLQIREEFEMGLMDGLREEADDIESTSQVVSGSRFDQMRQRSDDLQRALERIFFNSDLLGANAKRYLSF